MWRRLRPGRLIRSVTFLCALPLFVAPLSGQDTLPPQLGGYIRSLGLPPVHHPYASVSFGWDRAEAYSRLGILARVGLTDPIGTPVGGVLSYSGEAYAGVRDGEAAAGIRGLLVSRLASAGLGLDADLAGGRLDPFVTILSNLRRGGVAGRGTHLRLDWYPTRGSSLDLGIFVPLDPRHLGRTRPRQAHVTLQTARPRSIEYSPTADLAASLDRIEEAGPWINRMTMVRLRGPPGPPRESTPSALASLQARLAAHTVTDEIEAYHREIERAFSIAAAGEQVVTELRPAGPQTRNPWTSAGTGVTELGARIAAQAREILLERVLFPYNRLLGQRKKPDTTLEFAVHARGIFAHWLVQESVVPADRLEPVLLVFQQLLEVIEACRAANREDFVDSRLVWLPLQLALRPQDYVRKEDTDTLISHAVGKRILHGNRMWYVLNSRFHLQLVQSIADAEEYHILWIHDYRGLNSAGDPDTLSLQLVTRAYFDALTRRVAAYDSAGRIPVYMVFLDQHYFELNGSRDLLDLLQSPLERRDLSWLPRALADTVAGWQARLRGAVEASRLLGIERAEYGERWLQQLVKVHVSVTNPADPSFRSTQGISLITIPDDIMRDHRKAVAYDLSEEDPYRGLAMYAGMGVGEHYATAGWEDRALMLQGPAALSLRDAARHLLESQGMAPGEIPHVLRPRPKSPDYDERVRAEIDSRDASGEVAVRAMELHNATGFGPKEISIAQATLFNLTSPGAVFKIPDSLWMNDLFASLIAGAALRGTRILPIAPSAVSAPANAWGLAGIHDTMSRLLAFSLTMAPDLERAGGLLRPGLYDSRLDVFDLNARVAELARTLEVNPFLQELYPTLLPFLSQLIEQNGSGPHAPDLAERIDAVQSGLGADSVAKLHIKGFLYVSAPAWKQLIQGPPLTQALTAYMEESSKLANGESDEEAMARMFQRVGSEIINPILGSMTDAEKSEWVFYLLIGSPNLDHRSMLLDGEVAALVSDWTSLYAFFDFMLLCGVVEWVEDQDQLNALLPRPGWLKRLLARWIRFAL